MEAENTFRALRDIFAPWLRVALQDAATLTPDGEGYIIPGNEDGCVCEGKGGDQ